MKILGFTPLHYGKEYLQWTLEAVEPLVDNWLILYTPKPSYGHRGHLNNPDSKEELQGIAESVLGRKLIWEDAGFVNEGQHRGHARKWLAKYDMMFSVDYDEVWESPEEAIKDAYDNPCQNIAVGGDRWVHYWRSFEWANTDGFYPHRFQKLSGIPFNTEQGIIHSGRVHHFGYAISQELMAYKLSIHGHKDEIASSWYQEKFVNWTGETTHLHPASNDVWLTAKKVKKPYFMSDHPYFELDKII